ncbi:hypothetical protein BRYFOR_08578 [Marvinbryantia formatexigens DSM 14469]|uniref:Uncharacterized protein n=1 Tax=Marvinbryantia formatexigens DSM 14469 TaxID=478749 RepID=C6LIU8_9FIRM|nr:hypothetical protein [Marvinbryantia formatexigens]EET59487.1 hypothetical protein BRYFOR_08578 [Marvinbryantia formatexigens DSM 14469]UWO24035.1 hypothetical protein NQ534_16555 [Marvinbryantia formatexigens DSM 14469]SDG65862.1 hypothetical protein SAMN05660368_03011 [Marvinbryantia formatexigens]
MSNLEINTFIETMQEFGDIWTPEQVQDVYGDYSLADAINDRKACHAKMADIIGAVINS